MDSFNEFYLANFPNRSLFFSFLHSFVEMDARIGGRIVLVTNTFQSAILLLFNSVKFSELQFSELIQLMGVEVEMLKSQLIPLLMSKILIKCGALSAQNAEEESIKLNPKFSISSNSEIFCF